MSDGQSVPSSETLAQTTSGYDLRPLSTGEVLDRTFQLYRSRFALFASLAALPAAVNFVGGVLQLLFAGAQPGGSRAQTIATSTRPLIAGGITVAALLVYFAFYGITQAATTWAVAEIYLGRPASVRTAWRAAAAHWFRYVLVTLRQYWSILWWPVLAILVFAFALAFAARTPGVVVGIFSFLFGLQILVSCVYAVYAAIRVSLAVPASVIESLTANSAVRRSMDLLVQRKGRIFLMWLMVVAMSMIVGVVLSPLTFLALAAHGAERYILQMVQLTGTFLSSMLIGPIAAIALCLFYFDERVRHEGFDIEFLMLRAGGASANPVAEGATSPEPA